MDFYNVLFSIAVSGSFLLAFNRPLMKWGNIAILATFSVSFIIGLTHLKDILRLVLDFCIIAGVTWELLSKRYKQRADRVATWGGVVLGILVIALGLTGLHVPAGIIYLIGGGLLIVQGVYYLAQYRKKNGSLSGIL